MKECPAPGWHLLTDGSYWESLDPVLSISYGARHPYTHLDSIDYNQASDKAEKATKQTRRLPATPKIKPTDEPRSVPDTAPSKNNHKVKDSTN